MRSGNVAVVATLLVVSACGPSSSSAPETSADSSTPGPTAQGTTIVPDWITYTDETASFEISYPNSWVLFETNNAVVQEALQPLAEGSGVNLEAATIVFSVGLEQPEGLIIDPSANIVVEPLPVEMTVDEYASASNRGAEQVFGSWETSSVSKIQLGDREAVLAHASFEHSELDPSVTDASRWWMVQLTTPNGSVGWSVTCGSAALTKSEAQDAITTCEEVVKTFRLHVP